MGISGLLPLLKPIQRRRHLSEFAGQTVAVDAYVWLHRGAYACATELANGVATNKYVDYAMHRVRMLQHHKITPYLVFDGGPLPAKRGTESDRAAHRAQNLARGQALAARGQKAAARDCFCKCVDITPQMAFQLIKALKAEGIQYVVAPYEADAQLAFLARKGIVDAVLTEDSDLLVFGCAVVLFKFDIDSQTLCSISRSDFGSLHGSSGPGSISFLGWTDAQFRAMAILSGCDYLPSIQGVGLKTAHALLRKCKTADAAVRTMRLEGKRTVPRDYENNVRDAERVFLYQRVYDPTSLRLVHWTEIPASEEWDERIDKIVGEDIEAGLARRIAEGDACPISLLPMVDINPKYHPGARAPPLQMINMNVHGLKSGSMTKGKAKAVARPETSGGITSFFTKATENASTLTTHPLVSTTGSRPAPSRSVSAPTPRVPAPGVGRASGKRTLAGVLEDEIASRRLKRRRASPSPSRSHSSPSTPTKESKSVMRSKYFTTPSKTPTRAREKENIPLCLLDTGDQLGNIASPDKNVDDDLSALSNLAQASTDRNANEDEVWMAWEEQPPTRAWPDEDDAWLGVDELVTQEEGYCSPTGSTTRAETEELSSPVRPRIADFGDLLDILSSPPTARVRTFPIEDAREQNGLVLFDDPTDDIECFDEDGLDGGRTTPTPQPRPLSQRTIELEEVPVADEDELDDLDDGEEYEQQAGPARIQAVAAGLRARFTRDSATVLKPPQVIVPQQQHLRRAQEPAPTGVPGRRVRNVTRTALDDDGEDNEHEDNIGFSAALTARYSFVPVS